MAAKFSASADGTKVTIGNAAENALQIDSVAKTIKALAPYLLAGNGPVFRARRTTTQNLTSGVDAVIVFSTEEIDTNGFYNPATGRFQPTIPGYYQINAVVPLGGDAGITAGSISLIANGSSNQGSSRFTAIAASQLQATGSVSNVILFNGTTDFLEVFANVTGTGPVYVGATATVPAMFSGSLVRAA